jgi:hypothetical protein
MKEDVCKVCNGNDFIYLNIDDGIVEQCPLCTELGKLYEPQEIENETRTETLYPINS